MKRLLGIAVAALALATPALAQLSEAPTCPAPPPLPAIPAACDVATASMTDDQRWQAAIGCLDAIVAAHPDEFPGAVIGYRLDTQNLPRVHATGSGDTGFENNQASRIVSLASVTKPLVQTAGLRMIQEYLKSPDCTRLADGRRNPNCIFGIDKNWDEGRTNGAANGRRAAGTRPRWTPAAPQRRLSGQGRVGARPNRVQANGAWGTWMVRDNARGASYTIFPQILVELPNGAPYNSPNCDLRYGGVLHLRDAIADILETIGDPVQ